MDWKVRRYYEMLNKRHTAYPLKYITMDAKLSIAARLFFKLTPKDCKNVYSII